MPTGELQEKRDRLTAWLKSRGKLAVAFSGGVDSALLAVVAREVLGTRMLALKAVSPLHPGREHRAALAFAAAFDIPLQVVVTEELRVLGFAENMPDRCYRCKKYLLPRLAEQAEKRGFDQIVHGANLDDLNDYRPGYKAACELGIAAPLIEAGLTKAEIRSLSREMGLPTWNRPSMACLASRVPYGTRLTAGLLEGVAQAEGILYDLGFEAFRVRHHGRVARIEVGPQQFERLLDKVTRETLVRRLRALGYDHVCCDLEGYVQGSLNRSLKEPDL